MADNSVTDYVSAVCSAVAAVIALVTVVTVVVAVRQLLTEHRAYSSGLSQQALGPWQERVRTKRLLGLVCFLITPGKSDIRLTLSIATGNQHANNHHTFTPESELEPSVSVSRRFTFSLGR